MGGMILLPPIPLSILPILPISVKCQSKTIVSVLILCKNYRYESLLWKDFNEKIDFGHLFNANAFNICKRSQNSVFRNFRHSRAAFFV
ncbi:hypothetical protein FIM66_05090 [Helicobacter pylori]|nr:hypothetical protein FIM81_00595 [Helicobacter pylori]TPH61390.1 hypothetical protein FIM66_05090 [Helicobacter pylori]TPH66098.1 hypothetical protein FIM61_07200 [Helicobacter pylori]